LVLAFAVAQAKIAAPGVLADIHKEGTAQEDGGSPDQVEDTILAVHHTAYQETQGLEDHHDPNQLAKEGKKEDTGDAGQKEEDRRQGHLGCREGHLLK
jgi:hypothetical protein